MSKRLNLFNAMFLGGLTMYLLISPSPAYAKSDPKVLKECSSIKLDQKSFMTYLPHKLLQHEALHTYTRTTEGGI